MSISDKLQTLINGKTELVNTINEKAGTALTVSSPWSDLKDSINGLGSGGEDPKALLRSRLTGTLTEYEDNQLTEIKDHAFYGMHSLVKLSLPALKIIEPYALCNCWANSVEEINIPNVEEIKNTGFSAFRGLNQKTFIFPKVKTVASMGISYHDLKTLDFYCLEQLTGNYVFNSSSSMSTLIIRTSIVCQMTSAKALNDCGIYYASTSRIYVPDELVEDYKVATNWSVFADKILPLSELPEEE